MSKTNSIVSDGYKPYNYKNVIGIFDVLENRDLCCLIANDDNNFLKEGIVEGSLLFVDRNEKYIDGSLNVFKYNDTREPQYKLSRTKVRDASYIGKVMITMNQYNQITPTSLNTPSHGSLVFTLSHQIAGY